MARLRLTPQKREFFELYARASANAVEIARLLVQLLERFPDDGQVLISQIKEREHEGDELTHEVVNLLNRTFVTPFDRDDMYRLAGAIDDVCDHVDEAADNLGSWGVERVPEKARAQAEVILQATTKLDEAVRRLDGFRDSSDQLAALRELEGSSAGRTSTSGSRRRSTRSRTPPTCSRRSSSRTGSAWTTFCWSSS